MMRPTIWRTTSLVSVLLSLLLSTTTTAEIVCSTFDDGMEGWTATESGQVFWTSTGGNPGGYLRFQEKPGAGANTYIIAPLAFLGDWSALDGSGKIEYQHRVFQPGTAGVDFPYGISISGPGGSATWEGEIPPHAETDWVQLSVLVDESAWIVHSGTWTNLLANVADLRIRIEQFGNVSTPIDIDGIDNVCLVPEPRMFLLLALGGLAVMRRRIG